MYSRLPVLAAAAIALMALAACGDDDTNTPDGDTATPGATATAETPAAPTEPASETSSPTATAGDATQGSACPALGDLPGDAADHTTVTVELDGDGLDDTLGTYAVPSEGGWHVRLEFGAGGGFDEPITGSNLVAAARPLGAHDIDGDGVPEAFVTTGSGASARLVGLYTVGDCALERVRHGREPAVFPVGATVQNVSGLRCGGEGDLVRLFATSADGEDFTGGYEAFSLEGAELVATELVNDAFSGGEAQQLAGFDCGDLALD